MPRPWRIRYPGAKYHVTARGNGREKIYFEPGDYQRFHDQLESALELDEVILYAYACMPNHFHLLVETPLGNIQKFMHRLDTAYSMYFRYKHGRPGHCLQGRYGAKLVGGDDYLMRLTRYIHLNPIRTKRMKQEPVREQKRYLRKYAWSSYGGYAAEEKAEEMVDYRWLTLTGRKTMRGRRKAYERYVEGMIGGEDEVLKPALKASRYAVGEGEFCKEIEEGLEEARLRKGCFGGDVIWPATREVGIEEVMSLVAAEFQVDNERLSKHGRCAGIAKKVAAELCCVFTKQSQRQIGLHLGYKSNDGVGKQRARLRELTADDLTLSRRVAKLRKKLASG